MVFPFLLFYSSGVDPLLSGCPSTYIRAGWFGGWNQPCPVPSQWDSLLPAHRSLRSDHRDANCGLPRPPTSQDLASLYHHSDCWIWIWMLKKRQDHFNPLAAASPNWSLQSAQWSASIRRWRLIYPRDRPRGDLDGRYPQFTGEPPRLRGMSWNLPLVTPQVSGVSPGFRAQALHAAMCPPNCVFHSPVCKCIPQC